MTTPVLAARQLALGYGATPVLADLDLEVREHEILFIMGGSGCGKTTLLKALAGLLQPVAGAVLFEGRPLEPEGGPVRDALRRATGMVFQGAALLSSLSLAENVALPMRARFDALEYDLIADTVRMRLAQVDLLHAYDLEPAQLSGGMRKRAGIARALALDPRLLLFDEPSAGLDPVTAAELDALIAQLREDLGATVVVVSHDLASAERIADRVIILGAGRTLAEGTWSQVQGSEDPAVRSFLDRRATRRPAASLPASWEVP